MIQQLLALVCEPNDPERAFVKFNDNDDVVLLINNYGGLSNLELGALTQETLEQLQSRWHISPIKIYSGSFETSLNGPGFSITLCNLSLAAKECNSSVSELMDLLGAETSASAWPNVRANTTTRAQRKPIPEIDIQKQAAVSESEDIKVDPKRLNSMLRRGCEYAIVSEPNLTKWDLIMGDGDCGEAVKSVCEAILTKLDIGLAKSGSVLTVLHDILDAVDDMGGTLGAILGILLSAFAFSLRTSSAPNQNPFPTAFVSAITALKSHTGAREGDRTVMDVLLPFSTVLSSTNGDFGLAVKEAERKAEGTKGLKPRFGRASYVNVGDVGEGVPDPGAWAVYEFLRGLYEGMKESGGNT